MITINTKATQKVFWIYLLVLLAGYMFFDKGFAYFGAYPIYVAEIGLMVGSVCGLAFLIQKELYWKRLKQPSIILLFLFIIWQILRTIPFLFEYQFDAVRDAMLWGYAAYTILILLLIPKEYFESFLKVYAYAIPVYLGWTIVAFFLVHSYYIAPVLFNAPTSIFSLKAGDVGVHLAGIAAFLLLSNTILHIRSSAIMLLLWSAWWIDWVLYGGRNRGGMLSALLGLLIVIIFGILGKQKLNWKPVIIAAVLVLGLVTASKSAYYIRISYNLSSVFGFDKNYLLTEPQLLQLASMRINRTGTINWRLMWWKTIFEYTFDGKYIWVGKGYGVNLADSDGFQVFEDHSLRSPHNATMNILARSGIPGLVLWLIFLTGMGLQILKAIFNRSSDQQYVKQAIWFLAFWLAFLLNSSVDVYLEGPMGGVWFWSMIGLGMLLLEGTPTHRNESQEIQQQNLLNGYEALK